MMRYQFITLTLHPTQPYYLSGDKIKLIIKLNYNAKENPKISLKYREFKINFEGLQIIKYTKPLRYKEKHLCNVHDFIQENCHTLSKEGECDPMGWYLLDEGSYNIPFELKLPENLPPNFYHNYNEDVLQIKYQFKCSLELKNFNDILTPLSNELPVTILPRYSISSQLMDTLLHNHQSTQLQTGDLRVTLELDREAYLTGQTIYCGLSFTNIKLARSDQVKLYLKEILQYLPNPAEGTDRKNLIPQDYWITQSRMVVKTKLSHKTTPTSVTMSVPPIKQYIIPLPLPTKLTPTFESSLIRLSYTISLKFNEYDLHLPIGIYKPTSLNQNPLMTLKDNLIVTQPQPFAEHRVHKVYELNTESFNLPTHHPDNHHSDWITSQLYSHGIEPLKKASPELVIPFTHSPEVLTRTASNTSSVTLSPQSSVQPVKVKGSTSKNHKKDKYNTIDTEKFYFQYEPGSLPQPNRGWKWNNLTLKSLDESFVYKPKLERSKTIAAKASTSTSSSTQTEGLMLQFDDLVSPTHSATTATTGTSATLTNNNVPIMELKSPPLKASTSSIKPVHTLRKAKGTLNNLSPTRSSFSFNVNQAIY